MPGSSDHPESPPPARDASADGPAPPPKQGMSTGAKVAIGCGIVALLAIVAVVVLVGVGGFFVKRQVDEFAGGVEAQQEASETFDELAREYPFTAPDDGVVGENRAERFFAVTDATWDEIEDWAGEMRERGERVDARGGDPGVGDMMAGVRGIGELGRARAALAEALDEHEMSPGEYVWTGMALVSAYEDLDAGTPTAPAANVALAREHRAELAEIAESDEGGGTGKGMVLALAWTTGHAEEMYRGLGIDTLRGGR